LLNAWLDSEEEQDEEEDVSTLNYWATLLRPLWYRIGSDSRRETDSELPDGLEDTETVVVVCNRSGVENGATFAGSSALFHFQQSAGKPALLEYMSRRQEGICVWTT